MAYVEENVNQGVSIHSPTDEKVSVIENGNFNDEKQQVVQQDYHSSSEETANEDVEVGDDLKLPAVNDEHDGGFGWIVVFGAFMVQITTFGVISSWGVMQDYFHQHLFADNPSALVDLSFVGTLAIIFVNGCSPIVQVCVARFGLRPVMIVGACFQVIALELSSLSTQVWHLYLTQGIMYGIGSSCMYQIVMAVTPQWFTKNRGIAMGIVAGGSGIGGLILPLVVTPINQKLGYGWTYRILGFICLVCDIIACIFVKERIHRVKEKKKLSSVVQLNVLKNTNFLLFTLGSDIALFGYFVPFFFVPAYATSLGMTPSQGSNLIAVLSTMNFIGRLVVGAMADRIGKVNTNVIFTLIAAISSLLIWTFAFTYATLMGFVIVFGFSCGGYFALMSPISAEILGMERFTSGLSLLLVTNALPVFGSSIASAIQKSVSTPFFTYKMFTGVTYLTGALIIIILKFRLNKNLFVKI